MPKLLEPVRRLVDERPTYGYRRIGALLNRERLQSGLSRLNHKRIYRLMAQNGLLLQRYTGKVPGRVHEGRIITIRPNLRWTSDTFEVACWNGEVLRVAFALDTCDREVMAWCASGSGISGEMVRDLMLESVERRFGTTHTPQPIQWLSDNGSAYRAYETIDFAIRLGLVPCFTPVRSPQSNGMSEAFGAEVGALGMHYGNSDRTGNASNHIWASSGAKRRVRFRAQRRITGYGNESRGDLRGNFGHCGAGPDSSKRAIGGAPLSVAPVKSPANYFTLGGESDGSRN